MPIMMKRRLMIPSSIVPPILLFSVVFHYGAVMLCDAKKPKQQTASYNIMIKINKKKKRRIPQLSPFNIIIRTESSASCSIQRSTTFSNSPSCLLSSHQQQVQILSSLRGGSAEQHDKSDDEENEYDEAYYYDDDYEANSDDYYDFDFDFDDIVLEPEDWMLDEDSPEKTKDRLSPITVAYMKSAMGICLEYSIVRKLIILDWNKTINGFQVWRPITTFLIFPELIKNIWIPLIGYEMMSRLEIYYRSVPYDFWIMVAFGMITSVVLSHNLIFEIPPDQLGYVFLSYMIYIFCRYHERERISVFKFRFGLAFLPWFLVASRLLMENKFPSVELSGIFIGHIYYHYKTVVGLIRTPKWLISWYKHSKLAEPIRQHYKKVS